MGRDFLRSHPRNTNGAGRLDSDRTSITDTVSSAYSRLPAQPAINPPLPFLPRCLLCLISHPLQCPDIAKPSPSTTAPTDKGQRECGRRARQKANPTRQRGSSCLRVREKGGGREGSAKRVARHRLNVAADKSDPIPTPAALSQVPDTAPIPNQTLCAACYCPALGKRTKTNARHIDIATCGSQTVRQLQEALSK